MYDDDVSVLGVGDAGPLLSKRKSERIEDPFQCIHGDDTNAFEAEQLFTA